MDFFKPAVSPSKGKQPATFQDSTLILPIVSLANVAQLAADLLIHSLQLESVGCLKGKYHIPLVAPRDYVEEAPLQDSGLCTAIEVFQSKDGSLTLVQQRSPVIKSRKDDFVEALVAFIMAASFKRVLIVSGMDAGLMQHYDNPSPFRSLSPASTSFQSTLESIMKPLNPAQSLMASTVPLVPSSGITRRLVTSLLSSPSEDSIDFAVALMFVAEGDNRYDAHVFARCIDKILGLQTVEEKWKEPVSWKVGLYGQDLDREGRGTADLYG